jgi:hypothetical protein
MERNLLAIDDILVHKTFGLVSYQPIGINEVATSDGRYPNNLNEDSIYVRGSRDSYRLVVYVKDCEPAFLKERNWKVNLKKKFNSKFEYIFQNNNDLGGS